ncbi:unnamed protein product [Lampetra planeri]
MGGDELGENFIQQWIDDDATMMTMRCEDAAKGPPCSPRHTRVEKAPSERLLGKADNGARCARDRESVAPPCRWVRRGWAVRWTARYSLSYEKVHSASAMGFKRSGAAPIHVAQT